MVILAWDLHLRTQIDYINEVLLVMLAWDLLFHLPGDPFFFFFSFIRLRMEITSFHSPQASGGARAVGFIVHGSRWGWFGQIFTGNHGLGLRQF